MFTGKKRSPRQRGAVEFALFAVGDWLPRLVSADDEAAPRRRRDRDHPESPGDRATSGNHS